MGTAHPEAQPPSPVSLDRSFARSRASPTLIRPLHLGTNPIPKVRYPRGGEAEICGILRFLCRSILRSTLVLSSSSSSPFIVSARSVFSCVHCSLLVCPNYTDIGRLVKWKSERIPKVFRRRKPLLSKSFRPAIRKRREFFRLGQSDQIVPADFLPEPPGAAVLPDPFLAYTEHLRCVGCCQPRLTVDFACTHSNILR